jgi:hypothetical protein
VLHFPHILGARRFTNLTDYKPLTFAFHQKRDKCSPRQFNILDFIALFTTNIRHIYGRDNTFSRVEVITAPITHEALASAQADDEKLRELLVSTTALQLD